MSVNEDKSARIAHLRSGFSLNEWQVEPLSGCFKRDGNAVHVEPRVMDVLLCLAGAQGDVVTREQLISEVWAGLVVGEEVLTRAISELRTLLGDTARERRYIRTVPKRGYALIVAICDKASVTEHHQEQPESFVPYNTNQTENDEQAAVTASAVKTVGGPVMIATTYVMDFFVSTLGAFKRVLMVFLSIIALVIVYSVATGNGPKIHADFDTDDAKAGTVSDLPRPTSRAIETSTASASVNTGSGIGVPTLAVMPFVKLSDGVDQHFLAEGLSEEIRNALINLHGIKVVARTSSQAFKEKAIDVREIGKRLGVALLLEGAVRIQENKARITIQLTDTKTGFPQWSNAYDTSIDDVFLVQRNISQDIVKQIAPQLVSELERKPVRNQRAYNQYLLGRHFWHQRTPEGLKMALERFENALRLDPNSAVTYSGLADTYLFFILYSDKPREASLRKAKEYVDTAFSLDSTLAEAHASRGLIYEYEMKYALARESFRLSVSLNPSNSMARMWYGNTLLSLHEASAAFEQFQYALELDPLHPVIQQNFLGALTAMGRYSEAIDLSTQMYQVSEDDRTLKSMLEAMSQSGRYDDLLRFAVRHNFPKEHKPHIIYQVSDALISLQYFEKAKILLESLATKKHTQIMLEAKYALGKRDSQQLRRLANDLVESIEKGKMDSKWFSCSQSRRSYWLGIADFIDKNHKNAITHFNQASNRGFLTCHFDADTHISLPIYLAESHARQGNNTASAEALTRAKEMLASLLSKGWAKTSLRGSQIALYLIDNNYTDLDELIAVLMAEGVQPWSNMLIHPVFDRYLANERAMASLRPIKETFEENRRESLKVSLVKYGL